MVSGRCLILSAVITLGSVPAAAQTAATPTPPTPAAPAPGIVSALSRPAPSFSGFGLPFAAQPYLTFAASRQYVRNYEQVQDYGRCVSNISRRSADGVLRAAPNSADEREAFRRLYALGRACLPYGYRAPIVFLRGGIAEAMYRRQPVADATHVGGTTNADLTAFEQAEAARSRARLVDDRTFTALANCLVVRAPQAVRSFLMSQHGSDKEFAALDQVIAGAPQCTDRGSFPRVGGRSFIRAYIAESAYRWAMFNHAAARTMAGRQPETMFPAL